LLTSVPALISSEGYEFSCDDLHVTATNETVQLHLPYETAG